MKKTRKKYNKNKTIALIGPGNEGAREGGE
jgi:hypothetical protein